MTTDALRALYDSQLRTAAEVNGADEVHRIGPLWLATYVASGRGFVTYQDLAAEDPDALIDAAVSHYQRDPRVARFEWKTRGHDAPADLLERLHRRGFEIEDTETVMVGPASAAAAIATDLPAGYVLTRATSPADLMDAARLAGDVFGDDRTVSERRGAELVRGAERDPESFAVWLVRTAAGDAVCTGRIDFVPGTSFAGLWGGACAEPHRHLGLYRAVTAARARLALERGTEFLQSDCTEFSRPILERAGLLAITTTTPVIWRRP